MELPAKLQPSVVEMPGGDNWVVVNDGNKNQAQLHKTVTISKDRKHTGHVRNRNLGLNLRTDFVHSWQLLTALTTKPSHQILETLLQVGPKQCLLSLFSSWPLHRLSHNSSAPSFETVAHTPSSWLFLLFLDCFLWSPPFCSVSHNFPWV